MPEMQRPALPSLMSTPAAARVSEAGFTLGLSTGTPGIHEGDTVHGQVTGTGLMPWAPHVAGWGGEGRLPFLPSVSVSRDSPKPKAQLHLPEAFDPSFLSCY